MGEIAMSSVAPVSGMEDRVLIESVSAPVVALIRVSLEVERQLRLLLAASGGLDKYFGTNPAEAVALLSQQVVNMPPELATVVKSFWRLRNEVVHAGADQGSLALSGVDYGLRIVRMLANIPRPKYVVRHAEIALFQDKDLKLPSSGGKGVVIQSFDATGKEVGTRIYPSTGSYMPGMSVSWEWKTEGSAWGPTWYRDPDSPTGQARFAWDRSLEFAGRDLATI